MPIIEIMPIGRELLTGRVQEKNAGRLAQKITTAGGLVSRITILDDELETIAAELIAAKNRSADFVITTGGLGPTFDDITLAALSKGAGLELKANPEAKEMVMQRYREYFDKGQVPHADMIPERKKMFMLPKSAKMIPNYAGAAPGVNFFAGKTQVFALPGPPRELEPMFRDTVLPIIESRLSDRAFEQSTLHTHCTDESILSPLCKELTEQIEGVHLKTNPTWFGDKEGLAITISVWDASKSKAMAKIDLVRSKIKL